MKALKKVLVFSPYAVWRPHTNYETTISRSCQLRGASVRTILCDSVLKQCDIGWDVAIPGGRTEALCAYCKRESQKAIEETQLKGARLEIEWLGQLATHDEKSMAQAWADSLAIDSLLNASLGEWTLGEWVRTSIVSHFRNYPIDFSDSRVIEVYRGYLEAAAVTALVIDRVIREWKPDALLLFNGRMSMPRVAFSLARLHGIRVLVHERPQTEGTIFVYENEICTSFQPFAEFWSAWQNIPLAASEIQRVAHWLRFKRYGSTPVHERFASKPESLDIRQHFQLPEGSKILILFTSSTDEFAGDSSLQGPFDTQEHWVNDVVKWVGNRPNVSLIVRSHPSLAGQGRTHLARQQRAWYNELATRVPSNVRVVLPEDPISSYDLMDAGDIALSFGSTAGLEMATLGKPLGVVPPIAIYSDAHPVVCFDSVDGLVDRLDYLVSLKPSIEWQRMAFRVIYRYFFHFQIPFPLADMVHHTASKLRYSDADALKPNAEKNLDRLCEFLLEGTPLREYPQISSTSLESLIKAETEAFSKLGRSSKWLALSRFEQYQEYFRQVSAFPYKWKEEIWMKMILPALVKLLPNNIKQIVKKLLRR